MAVYDFCSCLILIITFVCTFSWKEIWVLDYISFIKYMNLCATINPLTIEDLEDLKLFLIFVQSIQARIAQLVAYWQGTGEVPGLFQ